MKGRKARRWTDVKAHLEGYNRPGLLGVIRDLHDASAANRRFLHARFMPAASAHDEYRVLVWDALFPDPLSQRPVRLRDANAAIAEFKRSTGNIGGTVDLMLEFVEAGTVRIPANPDSHSGATRTVIPGIPDTIGAKRRWV